MVVADKSFDKIEIKDEPNTSLHQTTTEPLKYLCFALK